MKFGMTNLETTAFMSEFSEKPDNNQKIREDGFLDQKRRDPDPHDHQQPFKATRPDPYNNTMPMRYDSFNNENHSSLFSSYQTPRSYIQNAGPLTPSQWIELQHQALIYKHIVANVPVPSVLINYIKKSLDPFVFPGSSSSSNVANSCMQSRGFRLRLPANNDLEPGRCRRTDGKKWRCSKEAVPDQKYCEKHINRGRHRSRKLVEGKNVGGCGGGGEVNNQFKNLQTQNAAMNRPQELKPHWTQLSMVSPDFSSSSSCPAQEKLTITDEKEADSMPLSWQNSIGGPLGEALIASSGSGGVTVYPSWCSYSPTGVFSRSK